MSAVPAGVDPARSHLHSPCARPCIRVQLLLRASLLLFWWWRGWPNLLLVVLLLLAMLVLVLVLVLLVLLVLVLVLLIDLCGIARPCRAVPCNATTGSWKDLSSRWSKLI